MVDTVSDLAPPAVGKMFGALMGSKKKDPAVDDAAERDRYDRLDEEARQRREKDEEKREELERDRQERKEAEEQREKDRQDRLAEQRERERENR